MGLWEGAYALLDSSVQIFVDTFSFKTILTSRRKGGATRGAPLDALAIDSTTGRCYLEMAWIERPDILWIFGFLK